MKKYEFTFKQVRDMCGSTDGVKHKYLYTEPQIICNYWYNDNLGEQIICNSVNCPHLIEKRRINKGV